MTVTLPVTMIFPPSIYTPVLYTPEPSVVLEAIVNQRAVVPKADTVKPPIGNPPIAEHTADTEQFPWSQHAPLTYRRFQLRNNFLLGAKNLVPNPFLN